MSARVAAFSFVLLSLAAEARADEPVSPDPSPPEDWLVSTAMHFGPLEAFPRFGVSAAAHARWRRFRFGGRVVFYPHSTHGNVTRHLWLFEPQAQVFAVDGEYVGWTFDLGVGAGLFRDDYSRVYPDVSRVAPGFSLGTQLEVRATSLLRPYLGARALSYFAPDIVDDKWLELTVGLRFASTPQ